jgi:hypothetical protein
VILHPPILSFDTVICVFSAENPRLIRSQTTLKMNAKGGVRVPEIIAATASPDEIGRLREARRARLMAFAVAYLRGRRAAGKNDLGDGAGLGYGARKSSIFRSLPPSLLRGRKSCGRPKPSANIRS